VSVHLDGPAARELDALREVWDPRMRRITPPHVTVVYPEETVDEDRLFESLGAASALTDPVTVTIGDVAGVDDGIGGVYATVDDPSGGLETLRDRLLLPPQRWLGYPFHTTIVHPRTSDRGPACLDMLAGRALDLEFVASEAVFTVTDEQRREVLERFPLRRSAGPQPTAVAGAVVVHERRVLLGHRRPDRASFPDTWDIIGGHVEPRESPRRALVRELREELGLITELDGPWRELTDAALGIALTVWLVSAEPGEITNAAPEEHDELRWFTADELHGLAFPHPTYPDLLRTASDAAASGRS
jgi:8-oxo-dGTP pyrophosphatase MutT (NUDIX family)